MIPLMNVTKVDSGVLQQRPLEITVLLQPFLVDAMASNNSQETYYENLTYKNPQNEIVTRIFVSLLLILITIANILMGCELDIKIVLETLKKPTAPIIGFFTQFFIMPTLAYTISCMILMPQGMQAFALGLFVTGCSPSGSASNFWTILLNGNVHLSVTMTFLSMIGALVMMPLWMNMLGYRFLKVHQASMGVRVPYGKIMMSLMALVLPLLVGLGIARYRPNLAAKARKAIRPFVIFLLAFVIIFGTCANYYMFEMISWPILLAGFLLPWCGFMFGCFTSILLGQKPEDVTAIAIETGVQNTGIAIMLLKISFDEQEADMSSLLPIIVACFTPGPLLIGYAIHRTIKYLKERRIEKCKNKVDQLLVMT